MKHHNPQWTARYENPSRIRFFLDTREGRQRTRWGRMALRIASFVLVMTLMLFALGWALGVAPTMQ